MENQDKLHEQFKDAAGRAEQKGFDRMESVWNRVEEKLDNKKQRRIAAWWKYTGIAALFLLFLTIGFFMLNENNAIATPESTPENDMTVIDTQKVNETFSPEKSGAAEAVVVNQGHSTLADSIVFINNARISRAKNIENPQYASVAQKTGQESDKEVMDFAAEPSAATADIVTGDDNKGFITFSGTVSDQSGPLPGASVAIKGTDNYVATDIEGRFSIEVPEDGQLEISYVGYNSRTIAANTRNNNTNIMVEDSGALLESAVVNTYRADVLQKAAAESISKKDARRERRAERDAKKAAAITSATLTPPSAVPASSFTDENRPVAINDYANADVVVKEKASAQAFSGSTNTTGIHSLQGQVQGITIASGSGRPGTDDTIILRGLGIAKDTQPLYIIDGTPADEQAVESLKPGDIIEVNILKDAAATAVYGNRGANGVIVITTKGDLSKKELRKLKRKNKKLEKQQKETKKDSIDFTKPHK